MISRAIVTLMLFIIGSSCLLISVLLQDLAGGNGAVLFFCVALWSFKLLMDEYNHSSLI